MQNNRFSIIAAVRNAYFFVGHQWRYLFKLGLMPFFVQLVTVLGLQYYKPGILVLEQFLWGLPSSIVFAWYLFIVTRLLLLGERVDRLPEDKVMQQDRVRLMAVSVIVLLLFNMGMVAMASCMEWGIRSGQLVANPMLSLVFMILMGGFLWALRFSIIHIVTAVGYPVRLFLRQVHGMAFSMRLIGMAAVCALPIYLVVEMTVLSLIIPKGGLEAMTSAQMMTFLAVGAPIGIIVPVLLNAAAAFALQEILGQKKDLV